MAGAAGYCPSARGGHAEAAYALVRLVRGVLSLSPGRKGGGPTNHRDVPLVLRRLRIIRDEADRRDGVGYALYRGDLSSLPIRPGRARATDQQHSRAAG